MGVSLKRWGYCLFNAVAGAALFSLGAPLLGPWLRSALGALGTWAIVPALLLVVAAIMPLARGRWLGWLGARHFLGYPPMWIAGILGFGALLVFWRASPDALHAVVGTDVDLPVWEEWFGNAGVAFLGGAAATVAVTVALGHAGPWVEFRRLEWKRLKALGPAGGTNGLGPWVKDLPALRRWLRDDREIESRAYR